MSKVPPPPQHLAPLLWLLTAAFVARVAGQMLVVFGHVTWLPPMSEWMSGLMPYPYLLPSQFVIIAVCLKACLDFTRGEGWFVESRPFFARGVLYFGYIYFGGMIVRYVVQMIVRPETRWLGGTIPIVSHLVPATFLITFGRWHRERLRARNLY